MSNKIVKVNPKTIFIIICSLIIVLIGTGLLIYYEPGTLAPAPSGAKELKTSAVDALSDGHGLAAGLQVVDENFKRAVSSQLAQIKPIPQMSAPAPTPLEAEPPVSFQHVSAAPVTLAVHTVGAPLNLRARPGTSTAVIGSLAPDTALTGIALSADGEWILVHVPGSGEPGWVFAGLVRVTAGDLSALRQVGPESQKE